MKRLERLGSVCFFTVTVGFMFHIIAMSFKEWKTSKCTNCDPNNPVASWTSSLTLRCYETSVTNIFDANDTSPTPGLFKTDFCIPNKFITETDQSQAFACFTTAQKFVDMFCAASGNQATCGCDYTSATKATVAFCVLTAFSLGAMIFVSHLVSFVKIDYILQWLVPICFSLLAFAMVSIIITLSIVGSRVQEEHYHLRARWNYSNVTFQNRTIFDYWSAQAINMSNANYEIKLGWCFGMEFLALYFSTISLVLCGLMFVAKTRPESQR